MRLNKYVLFCLINTLLVVSFPMISSATETTSYSGIYFTEKENSDEFNNNDGSFENSEKNQNVTRSESKKNLNLPKTFGENSFNGSILGFMFILISISVKKATN